MKGQMETQLGKIIISIINSVSSRSTRRSLPCMQGRPRWSVLALSEWRQ